MGNSDFKNRLLSFYGVKDTDFSDSTPLTGEERIAIVQNNLNVLATVNDLLSLIPCGFLNAPKNINTLDGAMDWFSKLKPSQGKKIGAVVSYFDTDSGVAEVMRFVGGNTLPETIKDSTNWEWFNSGSATFKGLYNNEQELKLSAPSPKVGDHAFVGDTLENSTLYVCSKNGTWRKSKRLFNDIVSKFDAVFSVENGEQLEMYDEFIADKALMDAEGNVISDTYLRIADRDIFINGINEKIDKIRKEKFEPLKKDIKNSFQLNPDDLVWDIDDRLSFAERPNNTKSKYGFVYLRNEKPLTDGSFSRTGDKIIYAIRFNHDLKGATINIPDNAVLDFTYGGSFTNGTLNLGENVIIRTFDKDQVGVTLNGKYKLIESHLPSSEIVKGKDAYIKLRVNDGWVEVTYEKEERVWEKLYQINNGNVTPTPIPNPDPVVPPTPKPVEPTVVNANVYSSTNNKYTALDTNNLKNSNYTGNIYQGDVMSDGTFKVKKSLVYSTTNEVVYGNQPSYSNGTQFGAKNATFKYAYNQVTHYWKDGQTTVFTYTKLAGRNPGADYVEPVAPPTRLRRAVISYNENSFVEATKANVTAKKYTDNLYQGDLYSDNTLKNVTTVPHTTENLVFYSKVDNMTELDDTSNSVDELYKYAYNIVKHNWHFNFRPDSNDPAPHDITYYTIVGRKPESDYVAPVTVVTANALSFAKNIYQAATPEELVRRRHTATLYVGNVMSDGTFQFVKELPANVTESVKYGSAENVTEVNQLNTTGDATNKYAYNVKTVTWDTTPVTTISFIEARVPANDFNPAPTIVNDYALSFERNSYDEVTLEKIKAKGSRINHQWVGNSIYIGKLKSDGSYESTMALPYRNSYLVKYGTTENETNVDNLVEYGSPANHYAYTVINHIWNGQKPNGDSVDYSYLSLAGRKADSDYMPRKSIKTKNVFSYRQAIYDRVNSDNLKAKNHTGILWFGDEMSDGSMKNGAIQVQEQTSAEVIYGNRENLSDNPNFGEKSEVFKYAFNATKHRWFTTAMNPDTNLNQLYSVEYYSNISRDASKDYGKQPVTPPGPGRPTPPKNLGSIYISPEDVEGVTVSTDASSRFNSYKARFLEDSGIKEINLNTVDVTYSNVTNSFVEGEFEIYNDTYKPLKVYRMNPNRVLELVGELDYYNTDYNSYGRNLNLENKVVGSNKAMVVKDSRVPELENLIVFFGESHTRRIGIKDFAGVIGIYQKGQQLTSVGSNSNGTLYEFDDLLPVTFVLGKDSVSYSLVHNDNSNTRVASHTYTVDTTSSTRYDFIVFNKAETLPENGITIASYL